jgi:formamidopyrimidine-DNA glycosylase
MPELPEVETVRRGLAPALEGRTLIRVDQRRPDLRTPLPERLPERLVGRVVTRIGRRAKYLLIHLDGPEILVIHLGMSGRMTLTTGPAPLPGRHDHVILETDRAIIVTFNDARRFGMIDLVPAETLEAHPLFAHLGPEPLEAGFTGATLAAAFAGKSAPVKAALLDQRVVAGLGNIYVCEALFRAGLAPDRPAGTITGARAGRLARSIRAVLAEAISAGGSSLRDYVQASGAMGYFQHRFAVYGREGEACPGCTCNVAATGGIRRLVQSNRSSFHCPRRQT